jgi:hypothetical protein
VSFYDGTTLLGTASVVNGQASFTTSGLSAGDHGITALYNGDAANAGSSSNVVTQTVQPFTTTTYLGSSADPAAAGQPVTFTATVSSGGGGTPTGTVAFYDGTTLLAVVNVVNGTATFITSSLSLGDHYITAVYSGDADFDGSTSQMFDQTID